MAMNYNKLWELLIDKGMIKKDLREKAGLSTNDIAKMGKNINLKANERDHGLVIYSK